MSKLLEAIIPHLVGIGFFTYILFKLTRKSAGKLITNIWGFKMSTLVTGIYLAIAINGILILAIVFGLNR